MKLINYNEIYQFTCFAVPPGAGMQELRPWTNIDEYGSNIVISLEFAEKGGAMLMVV